MRRLGAPRSSETGTRVHGRLAWTTVRAFVMPGFRQTANESVKEGHMRSRILLTTCLLFGVLAAGAVATSGDSSGRTRRWAVVYLAEPTLIGSTIVQGPVLFIHDDANMARGGPCTTVRLFEPGGGPTEEIASFHCIPTSRNIVHTFTLRTRPNTEMGLGCVLTEYQFAGDTEGHGVPTSTNAH
jgi:hypothetical protein